MPTSFSKDTSALSEALNTYVVDMAEEWHEPIMREMRFEQELDTVRCEEVYSEPAVEVAGVIQRYQGKFTPTGTIAVRSRQNWLENFKTDLEITEDQIEFFAKTQFPAWHPSKSDSVEDNGFVQKFLNQFYFNQWKREMALVATKGVQVAVTSGTAGTVLGSINGFQKVLGDAITAGNVSKLAIGAVSNTNIVAKVNEALLSLPEDLQGEKIRIFMPQTWSIWYSQNYKATHQYSAPVVEDPTGRKLLVDDFDAQIIPIRDMSGISEMWIDVAVNGKTNMIVGKHRSRPDMPSLVTVPTIRGLQVKANWHRFYGLRRFEYTYVTRTA